MNTKKKPSITEATAEKEYFKLLERLKKIEQERKPKEDKHKIRIDYLDK